MPVLIAKPVMVVAIAVMLREITTLSAASGTCPQDQVLAVFQVPAPALVVQIAASAGDATNSNPKPHANKSIFFISNSYALIA